MLGVVDPGCTLMALHLYIGLIKVVPLRLDSGDELKAFNCRLEDLYAIDIQFLYGYEQPTLAYLAQVGRLVGGREGGRDGGGVVWWTMCDRSVWAVMLPAN